MKALVTGGAGFIGSHLCDSLIAGGNEVAIVDNFSSGRETNIAAALASGAELHRIDVVDRDAVTGVARNFRPEVVFHLAAQIDVRRSVDDPGFDATVNVAGTANMLEAARLSGARQFVLASTGGAIYGEGDGRPLPLSEDEAALPLAPYGQSKLAAEGYVSLYRRLHGVDGVALRLGNVYGPRQDPFGEAGVIAIFCSRLVSGGRPRIFGNGRQTRDYVFVGDVVQAFVAAGSSSGAGPMNVGTGIETSVLELAELLTASSALEGSKPEFAESRKGEVERISIDPSRAAEELGWKAKTGIEHGLRLTWQSFAEESV